MLGSPTSRLLPFCVRTVQNSSTVWAVPIRVLLVEDEPDLSGPMSIALRRAGFEVAVVHTGMAAIAAADDHRPDVVVLDRGLPDMDGTVVAMHLREGGFTGPLIVASGNSSEAHAIESRAAGADSLLAKPFMLAELVAQVRTAATSHASFPLAGRG